MLPKVLTHVVSGTGNGDVAVRPYLDDSSKQKIRDAKAGASWEAY